MCDQYSLLQHFYKSYRLVKYSCFAAVSTGRYRMGSSLQNLKNVDLTVQCVLYLFQNCFT